MVLNDWDDTRETPSTSSGLGKGFREGGKDSVGELSPPMMLPDATRCRTARFF